MSHNNTFSTFRTPQKKDGLEEGNSENGQGDQYASPSGSNQLQSFTVSPTKSSNGETISTTPTTPDRLNGNGNVTTPTTSVENCRRSLPSTPDRLNGNGIVATPENGRRSLSYTSLGGIRDEPFPENGNLEVVSLDPGVGNGYKTPPPNFCRNGSHSLDPLNNITRSQEKPEGSSGDNSSDSGSLNNFENYRNQNQQQKEHRLSQDMGSTSTPSLKKSGYSDSALHRPVKSPPQPRSPPRSRKPVPENKPSLLLTPEENLIIFQMMGRYRQTMATAVAYLLVPTHDSKVWQTVGFLGIVCLVRDAWRRSYFIQLLSIQDKKLVHEQEIYYEFDFKMDELYNFLTFEANFVVMGILFGDRIEASQFQEALDRRLEAIKSNRDKLRSKKPPSLAGTSSHCQSTLSLGNDTSDSRAQPGSSSKSKSPSYRRTNSFGSFSINWGSYSPSKAQKKSEGKENGKKKKLTTKDIGMPMNFRHVQHIGWDSDGGYNLNLEDSTLLLPFLQLAGVSVSQLKDENTRKFINNFLEEHEVMGTLRESTRRPGPSRPNLGAGARPLTPSNSKADLSSPSSPSKTINEPVSPFSRKPARPVSLTKKPSNPPPPPPTRNTPGSSTSLDSSSQQPSSSGEEHQTSSSEEVSNEPNIDELERDGSLTPTPPVSPVTEVDGADGNNVPPPPPPPLPPRDFKVSNMSSESSSSDSAIGVEPPAPTESEPDRRSQLLIQIQIGVSLKKVKAEPKQKKLTGISNCLSEIRKGVDLKPIPEDAKAQTSQKVDGLAGALARALAERQKAINPDSSSSDDSQNEYDDEDWE